MPAPVRARAEATADNTSIRVLWEWSVQGLLMCLSVRVDYQPEGGSLMMYTVDSATATSATLSNLTCNTQYKISVEGCTKLVVHTEDEDCTSAPKAESNPVAKETFGEYVSGLHAHNNAAFFSQYQVINLSTSTHTHTAVNCPPL